MEMNNVYHYLVCVVVFLQYRLYCVAYEPQTWTANSVAELNKDLEACAKEGRRYMGSESYKESDCYVVEGK